MVAIVVVVGLMMMVPRTVMMARAIRITAIARRVSRVPTISLIHLSIQGGTQTRIGSEPLPARPTNTRPNRWHLRSKLGLRRVLSSRVCRRLGSLNMSSLLSCRSGDRDGGVGFGFGGSVGRVFVYNRSGLGGILVVLR